ncbi:MULTISPECIES: tail fiber protein [unclassified Serratia (in: enterobacteria)]|uniref:tail fiber protein n=1 Tax=unclassified Serratia (in: enterobacteria) TaxID=2647522 RepID=UPI003B43231C
MTDKTTVKKTKNAVNNPVKLSKKVKAKSDGGLLSPDVPQASVLKERFKAGSIPLQTDFADLIDLANIGRQAVGGADGQSGPAEGFTLSEPGLLELKLKDKGGMSVDTEGVSVKPGNGITVDADGVSIDPQTVLPRGIITMFSGSVAPAGWALCDGSQGTPDLRDRFIVGRGIKFSDTGGGTTVTGGATVTGSVIVDNTRLTLEQIPSHSHGYNEVVYTGYHYYVGDSKEGMIYDCHVSQTTNSGGSQGHSHGATLTTNSHTHSIDPTPPYYALAFIMKL